MGSDSYADHSGSTAPPFSLQYILTLWGLQGGRLGSLLWVPSKSNPATSSIFLFPPSPYDVLRHPSRAQVKLFPVHLSQSCPFCVLTSRPDEEHTEKEGAPALGSS